MDGELSTEARASLNIASRRRGSQDMEVSNMRPNETIKIDPGPSAKVSRYGEIDLEHTTESAEIGLEACIPGRWKTMI